MRRIKLQTKSFLWVIPMVILVVSSCKTARFIAAPKTDVKPISANKLIRNIGNNAFDYKYLSIKKIACQFDNGNSATSFKASVQAEKDGQIFVSLTKLNIPVARLWLTPDSVKMINYLENNYILDDYRYLSSLIGANISFQTINAIVSNNIFALLDENPAGEKRVYSSAVDSGMYLLQSDVNIKTNAANATKSAPKRKLKLIAGSPVKQTIYVDPVSFRPRKIKMEDAVNSRKMIIAFSEFTEIEKQPYPSEIFLQFLSPENRMQMSLNMSNFSAKQEKPVRFRIPDNFKEISHD